MAELSGVTSWTPANWRATHDAAGWTGWQGRHAETVPPFTGRPMGAESAPLPAELDELVNVAESPPATVAGLPYPLPGTYNDGVSDALDLVHLVQPYGALTALTEDEGMTD